MTLRDSGESRAPLREDLTALSAALEGQVELVSVRLEPTSRQAQVRFGVHEDVGGGQTAIRHTFTFELGGIPEVRIGFGRCEPPPELAAIASPSPELLALAISCFRRQFVYEWELFAPLDQIFARHPARWVVPLGQEATPTGSCLSVYIEDIGNGRDIWTLAIPFETMGIRSWLRLDGYTDIPELLAALPNIAG